MALGHGISHFAFVVTPLYCYIDGPGVSHFFFLAYKRIAACIASIRRLKPGMRTCYFLSFLSFWDQDWRLMCTYTPFRRAFCEARRMGIGIIIGKDLLGNRRGTETSTLRDDSLCFNHTILKYFGTSSTPVMCIADGGHVLAQVGHFDLIDCECLQMSWVSLKGAAT